MGQFGPENAPICNRAQSAEIAAGNGFSAYDKAQFVGSGGDPALYEVTGVDGTIRAAAAAAGWTTSGPAGLPMASRILAEQVRLLYRPLVPLAVNLINAAIIVAVVWPLWPKSALAWAAALVLTV